MKTEQEIRERLKRITEARDYEKKNMLGLIDLQAANACIVELRWVLE